MGLQYSKIATFVKIENLHYCIVKLLLVLLKDEEVCPSSLAKYFHDLGAVVEERAHDIRLKRTNRVIPDLGLQIQITGKDAEKGLSEVAGIARCGVHAT